jgi:hypothetical protein
LQQVRDQFGGLVLLESGFGMGMDLMPPLRHLGMEIGNSIDDWHGFKLPTAV